MMLQVTTCPYTYSGRWWIVAGIERRILQWEYRQLVLWVDHLSREQKLGLGPWS